LPNDELGLPKLGVLVTLKRFRPELQDFLSEMAKFFMNGNAVADAECAVVGNARAAVPYVSGAGLEKALG